MGCFFSPRVTIPSMSARCLSQMRRHDLPDWHILRTQDMPEISEPPCRREACYIFIIAEIDHVQTKGWARWKHVKDLAILFIANCQHRHFDRYNATLTVILQHLIADIF